MGIPAESVSAFASLGCLLFGVYSFLRSRGDKRDEKLEALETKVAEHGECIKVVQADLEWVKKLYELFKRE